MALAILVKRRLRAGMGSANMPGSVVAERPAEPPRTRELEGSEAMKRILPALVALLCVASVGVARPNKSKAWLDADKAAPEDPDFSIQGEYASEKPGAAYGVQVVALGSGAFDAYVLTDGLPGAGWDRTKGRVKLSNGKLAGGRVEFAASDGISAVIARGVVTVKKDGRSVASLKRIVRKSPTLGAKPPTGGTRAGCAGTC